MKRTLRVFVLFNCILLSLGALSQPGMHGLDSVLVSLKTDKQDTNRVNALNVFIVQLMHTGNYIKADSLAINALQLAKKLNFRKGQASAYNNIGYVYWKQGDFTDALKNYVNALKIDEEIDNKKEIGNIYRNIGVVYYEVHNHPEALENLVQSLKIAQEIGDKQGVANVYIPISLDYSAQGNYREALKNQVYSLNINKEIDYKYGISLNYENIGYFFIMLKEYPVAQKYFDSSLVLSKQIGNREAIQEIYKDRATLDKTLNNYKAAYNDYEMFVIYRDSLTNEASTKKLVSQQMSYEFEAKMAAEKAKEEEAAIIKADESKRKTTVIYGIIIVFIISTSLIVYIQQIKRKKEKALLSMEKQRVEDELANARAMLNEYIKNMMEKNDLLDQFKSNMEELEKQVDDKRIERLELLNRTSILSNEDWNKFRELFEQVHKGFFTRLKEKMPDLTQAETRLLCLSKLNVDAKQMCSILGVSFNTVKSLRHRLRKKLDLSEDDSLSAIANSI